MSAAPEQVDFGAETVSAPEKTRRVGEVFARAAPHYDRMNDILSLGAHRLWKRATVTMAGLRPGFAVLDWACGSGDIARLALPKIRPGGRIVAADIGAQMLDLARTRLGDEAGIEFALCDAEKMPFADGVFDRVFCAFGLRNVADRRRALAESARVVAPTGECLFLEFAPPRGIVAPAARFMLRRWLPWAGEIAAADAAGYRYLGESIERFWPPAVLRDELRAASFRRVRLHFFGGGLVCLARARFY